LKDSSLFLLTGCRGLFSIWDLFSIYYRNFVLVLNTESSLRVLGQKKNSTCPQEARTKSKWVQLNRTNFPVSWCYDTIRSVLANFMFISHPMNLISLSFLVALALFFFFFVNKISNRYRIIKSTYIYLGRSLFIFFLPLFISIFCFIVR